MAKVLSPPAMPPGVAAAFKAAPPATLARLEELRAMIFSAAKACGSTPIEETLKWGQPAYLPPRRSGTTIRLGWDRADTATVHLLVHCQTSLVSDWARIFPFEFSYLNNRAVSIPATGTIATPALRQMMTQALTYHRRKDA